MTLAQRTVTILLDDAARGVFERVAVGMPSPPAITAYVQGTDELGIWVRLRRKDADHLLLIRWEYVLTVDVPAGMGTPIGLRS